MEKEPYREIMLILPNLNKYDWIKAYYYVVTYIVTNLSYPGNYFQIEIIGVIDIIIGAKPHLKQN